MIQGAFALIRMTPACQSRGERPVCLPAAFPGGGYKPWQGGAGAHKWLFQSFSPPADQTLLYSQSARRDMSARKSMRSSSTVGRPTYHQPL